jgi:hypothetical protein
MRLPRFRFTVRRLMVAVAVVAILLITKRTYVHRLRMLDLAVKHEIMMSDDKFMLGEYRNNLKAGAEGPESDHVQSTIVSLERSIEYHVAMKLKYERAARYFWLPVEPDPPRPEGTRVMEFQGGPFDL